MTARVLFADDSPTMRRILRHSLNQIGVYELVEAVDGNQLLEQFQAGSFDLVLTDWNMPGPSGAELVAALRARDGQVPLVLLATENECRRVARNIPQGVSDYLTTPFSAPALREKLDRWCPAGQGAAVSAVPGVAAVETLAGLASSAVAAAS